MEDSESERLNSWKEIAAYLGVSVRTAERWERTEQLPAHRHRHTALSSVFAYRSELRAWWESRPDLGQPATQPAPDPAADDGQPVRHNVAACPPLSEHQRGERQCFEAQPDSKASGRWRLTVRAAALLTATGLTGACVWVWLSRSPPRPWLVSLTGSSGVEGPPAFSPDGRQVAYSWRPEDQSYSSLYVKLIGGGEPLRLTSGPASLPAWSPDGRYIAYYESGINLISALGGPVRKLTELAITQPAANLRPAWFPDSKRLAIVDRDPATGFPSIFELSIDTGERRKLTSAPSRFGDALPAISPDGTTLGFLRFTAGGVPAVHVMPIGGGELRQVTRFEEWVFDFCWTADSREILYATQPQGYSSLWRIRAEGGAPRQVPEAGYDVRNLAIAPAGNRLAFTRSTLTRNLWQLELDRPALPRKLAATTRVQRAPAFSPEGNRLTFESTRSGWVEIWTCDRDGHNLVQLTSMGALGIYAGMPRWSPEGTEIAFGARHGGNPDIYVVNAQGGAARRITTDPAEDVVPSFSRDGRWIYFASNRGGAFQVWKTPRSGGDPVQVTHDGGFRPMESADGKHLYYAKQQVGPGPLWRRSVEGGPETQVPPGVVLTTSFSWAPTDRGVVYLGADSMLKLFDTATGTTMNLASLAKSSPDFALSPDGRTLVSGQVDHSASSIVLLENFR